MYTIEALKDKILEMYPEIGAPALAVSVDFIDEINAYLVTFRRGQEELSTHLEKNDADECMAGIKCVYLGVQIAQFIKNFDERTVFSRQAA